MKKRPRLRIGRFEKKILLVMSMVALAPLIGALVLGRAVLHDAYHMGVNERIGEQLHKGVEIHRTYLVALRERAERTADAVAGSMQLYRLLEEGSVSRVEAHLREQLERYPSIASFHIREGDRMVAEVEEASRLTDEVRELVQRRELEIGERTLRIETTATAPLSVFEDFQQAGAEAELYDRLETQGAYVSQVYLWVYVGFLALVIIVALLLAVIVARRVTQRVTVLADATRRLGRGDMHVTVPRESQDEVGELIEAFNKMVEDLRLSRERIDYLKRIGAWQEFARRLAHEIKNPLTPIQLAAQELHRTYKGEDAAFQKKLDVAMDVIEEEVDTLRRLVGEFSSFAKLPSAALEPAELTEFVRDLEPHFSAIVQDIFPDEPSAPTVEVEAEGVLPVRIDAMMLKRCVDNLVRNALQAIRDGGGSRVKLSAKASKDIAVLCVDDDGPGIGDDARDAIFDPYVTTKHDGTGLGLAIVKKVILEHNGAIVCDVSPEGGARFMIELPLA